MQAESIVYKPFHLAIPSNDLDKSRTFFADILGCQEGRTAVGKWIDYNFFGSQLVAHFAHNEYHPITHVVDGIPVPNFGVFITTEQFEQTKQKFDKNNIPYEITKSQIEGVKQTLYVKDFTGNNILLHLQE